MNKKQYAFVGPRGRINRLFETEQENVPSKVTQIHLSEDQYDEVLALREQGKEAGWKDIISPDPNLEHNTVVEFTLPS